MLGPIHQTLSGSGFLWRLPGTPRPTIYKELFQLDDEPNIYIGNGCLTKHLFWSGPFWVPCRYINIYEYIKHISYITSTNKHIHLLHVQMLHHMTDHPRLVAKWLESGKSSKSGDIRTNKMLEDSQPNHHLHWNQVFAVTKQTLRNTPWLWAVFVATLLIHQAARRGSSNQNDFYVATHALPFGKHD